MPKRKGRSRAGRAAGALALVAALAGCSPSNLADVVKAAGQDNATVCARVTSVYGTLTYMRSNVANGDATCDTLSIKAQPAAPTQATIPMTITPTFTITPK